MTDYDSAKLRADLEQTEGRRRSVYRDSEGYWTIGIGHLVDASLRAGLPDVIIDALLSYDVVQCEKQLDQAFPWWRNMTDARQRALLEMCFNLGINRLGTFKNMLAALEAHQWEVAAAEALKSKWANQVGKRAERIAAQIETG